MQAVFLDACGVLYRRERRYRHLRDFLQRERLSTPSPAELGRIRARIKRQHPTKDRDARYDAFLAALGVTDPASQAEGRRVLAREAGEISLLPGVAETLRVLNGRGFKLGVITNTATPSIEKRRWLADRGIDVPFDCFVSSCEVGAAKPHPRIYEAALAQCRASADASLFVGHDAAELAGARAVGLKTVAFGDAFGAGDISIARLADLLKIPSLQRPSCAAAAGT